MAEDSNDTRRQIQLGFKSKAAGGLTPEEQSELEALKKKRFASAADEKKPNYGGEF